MTPATLFLWVRASPKRCLRELKNHVPPARSGEFLADAAAARKAIMHAVKLRCAALPEEVEVRTSQVANFSVGQRVRAESERTGADAEGKILSLQADGEPFFRQTARERLSCGFRAAMMMRPPTASKCRRAQRMTRQTSLRSLVAVALLYLTPTLRPSNPESTAECKEKVEKLKL